MLLLVLCCFFGAIAARRLHGPIGGLSPWLDRWVLRIALPALILAKLPSVALDSTVVVPVVVAWACLCVAVLLIIGSARVFRWSRRTVGTLLLITPLGNTSFLGLAVVEVALSRDHLTSALAFDQLGSFLALATYGSLIASVYGSGASGFMPVVQRLIRFVPFLALVASIPLRYVELSGSLHDALGALGRTVAPVAMTSLGLRFTVSHAQNSLSAVMTPLVVRLVLLPMGVFVAAVVLGDVSSLPWQTSILESAMPPMITAGVVAANSDLDGDLAAFVVGVGTIVSFGTLSMWSLLVR